MAEKIRLQKYISMCGVASRRAAEALILEGKVKVGKTVVTELGTKVDPDNAKVFVDGKPISIVNKKYYIALNKPSGYVTTVSDQFDRRTVIELVGDLNERLYPVGRLDYDSEGLLFLTNDGDFMQQVTHPSKQINKTYKAVVMGHPDPLEIAKLRQGILLDGKKTSPALVQITKTLENTSELTITISEGRNRQVRRMCEEIGHEVLKLTRTSIGGVKLGHLPRGKWRHLTDSELTLLGYNKK
ncbi:MAG: rRNA pseudouridine synthase [Clostridia bacterium]|nr:rRNA pseudouridine synthase [Clostridia bacterium]